MKKRAFSLIELSIVILIVGIIVAGVTQSSSLVRKMKLSTARSLTKSSPVAGINNLLLWLEATSEESFVSSINDQDPVALWNDINPQQTIKSNASSSNLSRRPKYFASGINGLPSVKCDGVDDVIGVALGSSPYSPIEAPVTTNNFTIFAVASTTDTHEVETQGISGTSGTIGQVYLLYPAHGSATYGSTEFAGAGISLGTNGVSVYEHSGSYLPAPAVYNGSNGLSSAAIITVDYENRRPSIFINGSLVQTGLTSAKPFVFPGSILCAAYGASASSSAHIGEFIVYGKHLLNEERQSVEKYLGQKWGIRISS
jgi:prepilin-type N-terminal cleavage/methylation domain-containing protein